MSDDRLSDIIRLRECGASWHTVAAYFGLRDAGHAKFLVIEAHSKARGLKDWREEFAGLPNWVAKKLYFDGEYFFRDDVAAAVEAGWLKPQSIHGYGDGAHKMVLRWLWDTEEV